MNLEIEQIRNNQHSMIVYPKYTNTYFILKTLPVGLSYIKICDFCQFGFKLRESILSGNYYYYSSDYQVYPMSFDKIFKYMKKLFNEEDILSIQKELFEII